MKKKKKKVWLKAQTNVNSKLFWTRLTFQTALQMRLPTLVGALDVGGGCVDVLGAWSLRFSTAISAEYGCGLGGEIAVG